MPGHRTTWVQIILTNEKENWSICHAHKVSHWFENAEAISALPMHCWTPFAKLPYPGCSGPHRLNVLRISEYHCTHSARHSVNGEGLNKLVLNEPRLERLRQQLGSCAEHQRATPGKLSEPYEHWKIWQRKRCYDKQHPEFIGQLKFPRLKKEYKYYPLIILYPAQF